MSGLIINPYVFAGGGGGGGGAVAYEYYRLLVYSNNGRTTVQVREMELLDAGGADLATGGTASANSVFSSTFSAAKAFDDDAGTKWITESGVIVGTVLQYRLTSSQGIASYSLTADNSDGIPEEFMLQGSNDGTTWTMLDHRTGETGWTAGEKRTYTPSHVAGEDHRYWRLYISANNSDTYLVMAELALRNVTGGTALAYSGTKPTGTASASSEFSSSFLAEYAFDRDTTQRWLSAASDIPGWIQWQFDYAVEIAEYAITIYTDADKAPKDFTLQYSDDGVSWTDFDTRTGETAWTSQETRTYTV